MKKAVFFVFKLAMVVLLFLLIFRPEWLGLGAGLFGGVRVVDVLREMRRVSSTSLGWFVFWIACGTAVKFLGIACGILRWKLLLAGQKLRMPFRVMVYQWFMGRALGLILPGTIGLDGLRLVESSRYTRDPVKCATVIAVEKLTAIIALSFLVFMTFPLGFKYLNINLPVLVLIMAVLLCGVAGSLLLLMNPRVIQVTVAVIPAPGKLRRIVNRLGDAVTAYAGSRGSLLLAVLCAVGVHLGTCATFQCTFMAIRAANTSVADILFVSPLMITASILAFTISGMGVREVAFGLVLGAQAGYATAILGGHLELWAGEIIPFVLSIPLLLFGGVSRERAREDQQELALLQAQMGGATTTLQLSPEQTRLYRRRILETLIAALFAGVMAGAFIALAESLWIYRSLPWLEDAGLFLWGPAAYGLVFAGVGLGIGAGFVFLYLLLDRFASWAFTFAITVGVSIAGGGLVIGLFRYQRDVLAGHALAPRDLMMIAGLAMGAGLLVFCSAYLKSRIAGWLFRNRTAPLLATGVLSLALFLVIGGVLAFTLRAEKPVKSFSPTVKAAGPNIILCGIDALRADYLRLYNPAAAAETPVIDAFAKEGTLFPQAFANAAWTKPSFGVMFTGRYPEGHGATSKTGMISPDVSTLAELLTKGGYYTKGFANNPNTMSIFGFDRGFVDYTDLKPDPLFRASAASMRLSLYQVLRKVFLVVEGKVRRGKLRVTDFYQPAESVTREALSWLDGAARPKDSPFHLYLHYMDPHDPFMDHGKPGVGYARARMENPDPQKYLEPMRRAYISEIEYLDQHLGAFFDGLKKRGLYDNTLIIFVADHGEEFFDHGGWWHGQTLYDELIHVPLIMKLPGGAHAGETNTGMARLVDLAPTMLYFAGLPKDPGMSGQPLFDGQGFANGNIGYSYAENDFEDNILKGLRTLDQSFINANEDNPRKTKSVELYNVREDPKEIENLADDPAQAAARQQLQGALDEYQRVVRENAPEPGGAAAVDDNTREQLQSLGYLGN